MASKSTYQRQVYRKTQGSSLDINKYFGVRNGQRFNPQLNVNYTLPALQIAAMRKEADVISSQITSLFEQPFTIGVLPGGLGDLVFSLAESPLVAKIFIIEPDAALQQLLNNNLRGYHLTHKAQITSDFQDEAITILLIDTIKDPTITVANLLNEQHLTYAIRVTANYQAPDNPNYDYTFLGTDNPATQLLLCSPLASEEEILPQPEVDQVWLDDLLVWLDTLLAKIIPSQEERLPYFAEQHLSYWVDAFTDESIDPNYNYEVLEMLGDRFMKASFADYLIQRIPKITERELTELQNHYLKTIPQSKLARDLGFAPHIRVVGDVKVKALENVLEAFFGALFRVSEDVGGGLGYYNVFSMIVALYQDEPFETKKEEVKAGIEKTVFEQTIIAKLHFKREIDLIFNYYNDDRIFHFTITLSRRAREYFEGQGIILPNIIGDGVGTSKTAAEYDAYTKALALFRQKGVTPEWVEAQREILVFTKPRFQPYLATARARLQREGFIQMTFSSPSSTANANSCVVQLIGHRKNGTRQILATVESCVKKTDAEVEVLRLYAEGK